MASRDTETSESGKELNRRLEESLSRGKITTAEAETIKHFFQTRAAPKRPLTDLQRRMQSSGG
ncbi:MAG: hypothetical protein ACOY5F_09090 [Pseudomonadota bacterium]